MSKLLEEKTTIFVIKEDVGAMISALGNVMNEFGHYDPSSSWHRAVIDSGGRKLWQQDVRAVLQSETSFFRNAKKGNVPFLYIAVFRRIGVIVEENCGYTPPKDCEEK